MSAIIETIESMKNRYSASAKLAKRVKAVALEARIARLEADLLSAPNPYQDEFELSKYKGWWVTDRTRNLPAQKMKG